VAGAESFESNSSVVKYYGVAIGRKPGVYTSWTAAQEQIKGWKAPKYRKFATWDEAEAFVGGEDKMTSPTKDNSARKEKLAVKEKATSKQNLNLKRKGNLLPKAVQTPNLVDYQQREANDDASVDDASEDESGMIPISKRQKLSDFEDEFLSDADLLAIEEQDSSSHTGDNTGRDILTIYTDGSSLGNGKTGARAGVGVFFGNGDPR
jgi:ribonuclease HI